MTIPKGVTVRKMGEPPRNRSNNLLLAAQHDRLSAAKAIICSLLAIPMDSPLAKIHLSDPGRWARLDPSSRLMEIAAWLHAECYEAMDLVDSAPVSTLGD